MESSGGSTFGSAQGSGKLGSGPERFGKVSQRAGAPRSIWLFLQISPSFFVGVLKILVYLGGTLSLKFVFYGCFCKIGAPFVGVLRIRALLLGVCIRAPEFWKLPSRKSPR